MRSRRSSGAPGPQRQERTFRIWYLAWARSTSWFRLAPAQDNAPLLQVLDLVFGDLQLLYNIFVVLSLDRRRPGMRQLRATEYPGVTGHPQCAAAAIVDLNDRIPFPDPIGLGELVDCSHAADGEACFTDLRLQLLEAIERRQPGTDLGQQGRQIFPA